jgi:DNA-binding CsgD family transcriptional regulator
VNGSQRAPLQDALCHEDGSVEAVLTACPDGPIVSTPAGLRGHTVDLQGDQYVLLSVPVRQWHLPQQLTPTERAIALAVLSGASNEEVARTRGTSARTVANHLASIFQKTAVSSRIEFAAICCRRTR